ncbi:MAG TPA: TrmH family RNA methyltransferase [Micromonosporaceae bacterium]|jgi:TrmH family RNA methyltransferase
MTAMRVTARNAGFQQWQALLTNRTKRQRSGSFLVHGVRPISLALAAGWPMRSLLYNADTALSSWARDTLSASPAEQYAVSSELMHELGEKADDVPELIAIVALPDDDLGRLSLSDRTLGVVFDRPSSPGNIGTLIRSADAFGADFVLVTGHAADPYDPRAVRASAGSVFGPPVVRVPSHAPVLSFLADSGADRPLLVATDEAGDVEIADADLTGPVLLLIGNETAGLSSAWREAADLTVRIPIGGLASSLNAAGAGTVALYEVARQRSR